MTDAFRLVLRQGGRIVGVRLRQGERRYDVGNFQAYYQAFIEAALEDPQCGAQVRHFLRDFCETHREV